VGLDFIPNADPGDNSISKNPSKKSGYWVCYPKIPLEALIPSTAFGELTMDAIGLIPNPDPIPGPAWFFLFLDVVLFAVHILLINIVLGSLLIAIFERNKGFRPFDPPQAGPDPAAKVPTVLALGINFGVAPLLFMQVVYGHLFYTSSVLMAVFWILVIPFLILAYYGTYVYVKTRQAHSYLSKAMLFGASILILYIGFMFVNNMTLMIQPQKWIAYFRNPRGTLLNLDDPTVIPRYLHFVAASVAVGGLFMAVFAPKNHRPRNSHHQSQQIKGLAIFSIATMAQATIGLWFLMSLPRDVQAQFMGRSPLATGLLLAGFASGIASIGAALTRRLRLTIALFASTIGAMVLMRHMVRVAFLAGKFDLNSLRVNNQYGPMALFLAVLIMGIAAIVYMLRLGSTSNSQRMER